MLFFELDLSECFVLIDFQFHRISVKHKICIHTRTHTFRNKEEKLHVNVILNET